MLKIEGNVSRLRARPAHFVGHLPHPQDRRIPIREAAQKLGGRLIDAYYCFGEYDAVVLAELPDDHAALATAMTAVSPGHLKAIKTTKLFSVEETMEAMRTAGSLVFQGPSKG